MILGPKFEIFTHAATRVSQSQFTTELIGLFNTKISCQFLSYLWLLKFTKVTGLLEFTKVARGCQVRKS